MGWAANSEETNNGYTLSDEGATATLNTDATFAQLEAAIKVETVKKVIFTGKIEATQALEITKEGLELVGASANAQETMDLNSTAGGVDIKANNVKLTNMKITSVGRPVYINDEKTGIVIKGGTYLCTDTNVQGAGTIWFHGKNGDIYVEGATIQGGISVNGCNGSIEGIKDNVLDYKNEITDTRVALNILFEEGTTASISAEALAKQQKSITMSSNGAQYQVLYQKSDWSVTDGLTYANTKENLVALVGNSSDVKANVQIKLKANTTYSFDADLTIHKEGVRLEGADGAKLAFTNNASIIVDVNNVVFNNLDVTSTYIALKINQEKTDIRINGGTYTCSVPDAEGVGPINFLGKNGDIYVSGATLTGKLGITNVTGKLNGITGNTIKFTSTSSAPVVGISALFDSTLPEGVISPVELAAQNTITMPAAGAQYPVLYESSAWKGLDGLAYADTKDNLAALVGNSYGVKGNVLIKLKANTTYSYDANLTIQQEGLTLEGAEGAKVEFTEGGIVVAEKDVILNNVNVTSNTNAIPLSISDGKTGVKVEGGSYSFTNFESQGLGAVSFLGNNGDIYIKNVTTQGGLYAYNCNGKIDNIIGNTIQYSAKPEGDTHSYAGINLVFNSKPETIITPEELLAKQKSVTMPDKGDQYQILYQTSAENWPVFDGLATVSTSDALVALAANKDEGKNNIRINLANDITLTAPVLFTQTGMTLDGKGKTVSVADDFAGGDYPVVLGNNNTSQTGTFTIKDLTLDNRTKTKGLSVYQMQDVTLENVTLKNSAGAGLIVNGSKVTASGLVTENNSWGGVNVGPGSNVTSDCTFTLLGNDNNLQEEAPIYVDKKDVALIDAATGQKITITSPGYIKPTTIPVETAAVWTKYTVPAEGIASDEALKEAVANNQKEIVLPPTADPESGEATIELTETLTVNAEITIKSENPDVPAVITVPEGTSAFTTGEGGKLTLDNVVIKTTESESSTGSNPVIKVVEGTEATLQNSTLEVPANVTAIEATGNMTISDVKLTVDTKTEGDAPVINVAKGGDVTIDNAAITNGTIEVTGTLTIEPAEKKEVIFTQTSEDKPALDLKDGANVTVTNAQFTGKAVKAASGATINFSKCNFSSPEDTKAVRMTRSTGGDDNATVIDAGDATATIEGCIFTGIKGKQPMLSGKNLTVKSCLFYDNEDMVMIDIAAEGTSVIANNTCVNNNEDAEAIINNASSTAVIKNNIFWTNADEAITGTATGDKISHNALKTAGPVTNNNLTLPSLAYIKFDNTTYKYQLHKDSPIAQITGDATGIDDDAKDILGADRLTYDGTNKTVHLGAYESVYTPTTGGGSTGGGTGDTTPDATGIKLDKTTLTLARLQSYTLVATVEPAAAGGVKWTSTDPSVATVDANGKVTAVKVGQATIIATAINGGLTALCQVTVDFATGVEEALAESTIFGREGDIQIQPATPVEMIIVNMAGTIVAHRTISQAETISVSKGIYIVRLNSGGHVLTQKVNVR